MDEAKPKKQHILVKRLLLTALLIVLIGICSFFVWKLNRPKSLLPKNISATNAPYFYFGKIPAGYYLKESRTHEELDATAFGLAKPGKPEIILTEQKITKGPDMDQLMQNGEEIKDAPYPAVINAVEGRIVAIMSDTDSKTLVILNAPGNAEKQDLKQLLLGLKRTD